ncbi:unnamed protein product [Tetraodon nigroviridis]|uniref:(spotted green pufferfish) hypothetical protein n=1 Tax=Tetraodon nigroviridis TaxID=99883 RepID=Q4S3G5_TETNG|nr:unnamed protein product [Tetraodon nigroviridis]
MVRWRFLWYPFSTLHGRLVGEHAQLKEELEVVRQDNIQLVRENNHIKQACEELRRLHDDDQREVADMRLLQKQVMREGTSDVLNKLYDTVVEKLEAMKNDYEALRKRYNEKTAGHNADLSRLDQAEEENHRLQKQLDMLLKQRDAAMHYQQQYSSSIRRFDNTQQELSKAVAQNKELQREMERLQSEVTRLKTQQLKASKDGEKFKQERDSVISEYRLIMSERDQVIKEVDRLQTGLEMAEAKLKNTSSERRVANEELEALRQRWLTETGQFVTKTSCSEKYCHEVKDKAEAQKELSQACKDIEMVREERDVARKERTEAIIQRDQLLREYYQARQKQDSATLDMERANKEIDMLRKQCEAISQELKEALQEAEVAKCRRDWAFQERDKIVAERESIRTLCDNLRRERDRAVSDLADALRNLDDMRKQKNDTARELKELREKMEDQLEKEARFRQLMAHSSHDSAIDTDSMEWETEVVEFEKHRDMDLKALGIDVAEGVNDPYLPGDCGIVVTKVDKGSLAEGRLRVNDWLLKINDVDLTNKDRKQFLPQSWSGQSLFESVRDSEKLSRLQSCEIHTRNCRNSRHNCPKHNCSTQTDTCSCDRGDQGNSLDSSGNSAHCHHKPFSNSSIHSRSLSSSHGPSEPHPDFCYMRQELHPHYTFNPALSDCSSPQNPVDLVQNLQSKPSGGTWPKVLTGASISEFAQLSIYKRTKQRKSIFDVNAFKRPEAPPKLDYMSLSQMPKHSPQSSMSECAQTPPTPPARSDSFRFKHRQQNSSASDSTITTGTPPASPAQTGSQAKGEMGNQLHYVDGPPRETKAPAEEERSRRRAEERGKRRYRPKSAPALRRNVTPVHIPVPMQVQSFSNDEHSPEPVDLLRFSPLRTNRYSIPFTPPGYSSMSTHSAQRGLAPCPAVTAVMRNPVFTAWSHEIQNNNCPPASNSGTLPHTSPQHQGCLSLDLSHKHTGQLNGTSCSQQVHSANSLPPGGRLDSSTLQFRTERIKIPPARNPRSTGSDRGSLSHSECSSPTPPMSPINLETSSFTSSQSQGSISAQPRISVSPVPAGDRRKPGPYLEEPRNVTVQRGTEPLGISIVSGENGGVFVSKVTAGSIAHQAHLEYGDQLLEFNGINLRNANEQQARLVIGQQCDTVTILAQYNPHMFQLGNHSHSGSRIESISNQPTPQASGATTPDNHSTIDTLSEQDEGTITPSSNWTTPATSAQNSFRGAGVGMLPTAEPRLVRLNKVQVELGVQICGGNLSGIFVESLDEDSPAKSPDGVLPGDLILEYNGISMKNKTKEEAYLEMLKPAETITFKVQNSNDKLSAIKDSHGDGFYIRALYERVAEVEQELSFNKDDILYVEDTLPNGNFGYWMAWQLDENARKLGKGQIPSKYMMDQEFYKRHGIADPKDDNGASKTLSAAARRSFFRRRLKHKRSGSKDGKDLVALEALGAESLPITEDGVSLMYQRVQRIECSNPRPVLLLGPLVEVCKDVLVKESPAKFSRCPPEIMKASQQAIERGVKDCVFIDYKRRSGHFDVTTVASIKEITEKDCHCLLDIAPYAIERLHSVHIYPIIVFIRYKNAKQIKEQKDPFYLREKLSQKHSKEQFEAAQKIEQDYSRFFTGWRRPGGQRLRHLHSDRQRGGAGAEQGPMDSRWSAIEASPAHHTLPTEHLTTSRTANRYRTPFRQQQRLTMT